MREDKNMINSCIV